MHLAASYPFVSQCPKMGRDKAPNLGRKFWPLAFINRYVGSHFANYDSFLVLTHFKGHAMAGFGGAIKNISIGFGSSMGKVWIHSGGTRQGGSIWGEQDPFLEAMADAAKGVNDSMGENILYISVLNRLSVDCDCDGSPAEPDCTISASWPPQIRWPSTRRPLTWCTSC